MRGRLVHKVKWNSSTVREMYTNLTNRGILEALYIHRLRPHTMNLECGLTIDHVWFPLLSQSWSWLSWLSFISPHPVLKHYCITYAYVYFASPSHIFSSRSSYIYNLFKNSFKLFAIVSVYIASHLAMLSTTDEDLRIETSCIVEWFLLWFAPLRVGYRHLAWGS